MRTQEPKAKRTETNMPPTNSMKMASANRTSAARPNNNTGKTPSKGVSTSSRSPSREEIARRAYELWIARGRTHGHDREDWVRAEQELRNRK